MDVDAWDTDAVLAAWNKKYSVKYAGCGKDGGASKIATAFNISSTPSVRIIAPNKTLLYSATSNTQVDSKLSQAGLQQHACDSPTVIDEHTISGSVSNSIKVHPTISGKFNVSAPHDGNYTIIVYTASGAGTIILDGGFLKQGIHEFDCNKVLRARGVVFVDVMYNKRNSREKVVLY